MDDGSEIKLSLTLNAKDGSAIFDFAGTAPEVVETGTLHRRKLPLPR